LAFVLEGHPREDLNTSWRVVRMTHRGSQPTSLEEDNPGGGTHYAFQAELVPAAMDWKAPLWSKPRIDGPHVATVVGPPGEEAVADTWGRVKVRFPWDRSDTADDHRSCWIRVAQGWAGASYGAMLTPRAGHEVLVDFLDGDPDQPIITGRMHHVAQLPPYELPRFQALSVVKTKELDGQRANELRLDDTHGQISAALTSDHEASALHLGYLTHPRPDGGQPRGEGFELRTDGSGTLRAAKGLLLTTDGQARAVGGQVSRDELVQGLERALALVRQLGERASDNGGVTHDSAPQSELTDAIRGLGGGANDQAGASVMALSSPAGIAAGSPKSITLAAGQQLAGVAGIDLQLSAGQHLTLDAGKDLGISAHAGNLRQIAHEGDMLLQAQTKNIRVQAAKDVDVAAEANLTLSAVEQVLVICDGAYLKMSGGNMEIGLPGTLTLKAGQLLVEGPSSMPTPSWSPPTGALAVPMITFTDEVDDEPLAQSAPAAPATASNPSGPDSLPPTPMAVTPSPPGVVPINCPWRQGSRSIAQRNAPMERKTPTYYSREPDFSYSLDQKTGVKYLCSGRGKVKFDLAYDAKAKTLTATVRIFAMGKEMYKRETLATGPGPNPVLDAAGKPTPVAYQTATNGSNAPAVLQANYLIVDRSGVDMAKLEDLAKRIKQTLNQDSYQLQLDECTLGDACACKVRVIFEVEFSIDPKQKKNCHATVSMFSMVERADANAWGEEGVTMNGQGNYVTGGQKQVEAHETGHLFSWPDEYFARGGFVHERYVTKQELDFLKCGANALSPLDTATWQINSKTTLMGYGCYQLTATTPPYYLESIVSWFSDNTQKKQWKVVR
jgi:uncharacterized protein (DUF2345 family)